MVTATGPRGQVKSFTNPEEALDDLHNKAGTKPILVLLDVKMPEISGFEFLEFMEFENFPSHRCHSGDLHHLRKRQAFGETASPVRKGFIDQAPTVENLKTITIGAYSA